MLLPRYAGCVFAVTLTMLAAVAAFGQDKYPSRLIHIYTSEAGSTNDIVARELLKWLETFAQ